MKNSPLFTFVFILLALSSSAQISILSSDIGDIGDTARYSYTTALNPSVFEVTGANYTWDFSQISPMSQSMDQYQSLSSTSIIYSFAFTGKASQASPRADMNAMGINIANAYNFFSKTSSVYKLVGYGGETSGTPIPVVFNNPDIIYHFPMAYGNLDSCDSDWSISAAGTGYIAEDLHRVNEVDGWGTITTPYGTFNCLRIKSDVIQDDTVYIASSGLGMRIPQVFTEYIWLAKNMNFPIMKVTISHTLIGQIDLVYMDSIRQFVGIESVENSQNEWLQITPNPASDYINVVVNGNSASQIVIVDSQGKIVYSEKMKANSSHHIQTQEWAKGMYVVQLINSKKTMQKKIIIQ